MRSNVKQEIDEMKKRNLKTMKKSRFIREKKNENGLAVATELHYSIRLLKI
jgi:hypothetical protein